GRLERATEALESALTLVGHLESVATTPALRKAYNEVKPEVSAFYAGLPLDEGLWNALKAAADAKEQLAPTKARHLARTIDDFRRQGAELDVAGKMRLEQLTREFAQVTLRFAQNSLDSTVAWEKVIAEPERLAGLPESAVEGARHAA